MAEITPNGAEGTPPSNELGAAPTAGAITFTDEQQAKIAEIKAQHLSSYKKSQEYKELHAKALQAEELLKKQKEKEEAELTELDKLKRELGEVSPYKERAAKLEETLATYLEAEIERIPEDLRGLIPDELSVESKLAYIAKNRERLMSQPNTPQGPRVTNSANGKVDSLMQQATQEAEELCKGKSKEYTEAFIKRRYESLKMQKYGLAGEPSRD